MSEVIQIILIVGISKNLNLTYDYDKKKSKNISTMRQSTYYKTFEVWFCFWEVFFFGGGG